MSFVEKDGRLNAALFGDLGERTGNIRDIFGDLDGRLAHVNALAADITDLRRTFDHFLRQYHDLALLNVTLGRDKERLEAELQGLELHCSQVEEDHQALRASYDDGEMKLEKALANIESYEQNVQLLGVAKRELEEKLQEAQTALAAAADEETVLRQECAALKLTVAHDEQRIDSLSGKYQDSFEKATSLGERCDVLDSELRQKDEQLAGARDENARLVHETHQVEKEKAHLDKLVSDSRTELTASFERYQKDVRLKDEQLGVLNNELKSVHAREHMLQKVNADLKSENEKFAKDLREALEANRRNEVQMSRYEAKVGRLTVDGEAALNARKQLDQARLAMVARIDALSQSLRVSEVDIRRLENEASTLTQRNQDMEVSYAASIEQLTQRIHELEGQLEHQMNENAYIASKFSRGNSA
ncbi:MAG TPA: hypothetical protein VNS79_03945 [Sphingobium sp.]|nr:hypothetical protein [Sphingobium sp.]